MNRSLLWLLVPVVAAAVWLALRFAGGEPAPAPEPGAATSAAPPASPDPVEATTASTVSAAVSRVEAAGDAAATSKQPPIPDDAIWLDVEVIDAETKQRVAGAEVRWSAGSVWQQIAALPEYERQEFYGDQERSAVRFGWLTHTDSEGKARVASDRNGANVHVRAEDRYGTAYIGGQRVAPKDGWVIEVERDLTLRARVLDALGRPAVGAYVAIRLSDQDDKALRNYGQIRAERAAGPDAVAEFRHVQRWLRSGTSRKRDMQVGHWRVVPELPGVDGPAVEFDVDAPPAEPVVLRLPATGRIAARLLHDGQPFTEGVTFQAYRGDENDNEQHNNAPRYYAGEDGWARIPFVAVGGSVVVLAQARAADVAKTVEAPLGQDQEVRVELTTEELYVLRGQFTGPDGAWLANGTVQANYDFEVMSGGGLVETDAQGRFVWLLTKGYKDRAQIESLVFSQQFADGTPARTLSVTPREIHRGVNDLGVLQLSNGPLVVSGKLQFDTPQTVSRGWFEVQALSDRRGRNGEERWERVDKLTKSVRDDGTFEVRGDALPVRHRLAFRWGGHLPIAPVEFRAGATDLVIPIRIGQQLEVKVLVDDDVPVHLLRGTLRPGFEPPTEYGDKDRWRSSRGNRYQAEAWGAQVGEARLGWQGLPAGTYALEVAAAGLNVTAARIEDVVLPLPEGGDDRLEPIDLRGKLHILEVRVSRPPGETDEQRRSREAVVFAMPQADEQHWQGLPVNEGKLSMPIVPGPLELMVVGSGFRPQRVRLTAEQVATGKLTLELAVWPKVELLFPDLPALPEGFVLHAQSSPVGQVRDQRRFTALGWSGGLDGLLQLTGDSTEVQNGRAMLTVGDGTFRLGAYLMRKGSDRGESLRSVTPREIQGGENLAPINVQLSAEEFAAAIEKLGEGSK